jgi:phytoene synthase
VSTVDVLACRQILRQGSRSFHAASLLLPRRVGDAASAIYAFCRVADNAVDEPIGTGPVVSGLEDRLGAIYSDDDLDSPVDRAFRDVVRRHEIPREVPETLLEGLLWDETGRTYSDLPELYDYGVRVGSTVGVMMTLVMGRRDARTLVAASELGLAMQLTNIARDVGEDARRGRIYLPVDRLQSSGIDPGIWLTEPMFESGIGDTVAWLLDDADRLYARSWKGISRLPASSRPAIRAAALMYAEIGNEIRRAGCDSVSSRAWTTRMTKLRLLARAGTSAEPPVGAFSGAPQAAGDADGDRARQAVASLVAAAASDGTAEPTSS